MIEHLVCVRCWKWYDGRTVCPVCRGPLIDPTSGRGPGGGPLPHVSAPAQPAPSPAPPPLPPRPPGPGALLTVQVTPSPPPLAGPAALAPGATPPAFRHPGVAPTARPAPWSGAPTSATSGGARGGPIAAAGPGRPPAGAPAAVTSLDALVDRMLTETHTAGARRRRLLVGAAATLAAGLAVSAAWLAAAAATGLELAPLAVVVGVGAGMAMRRWGGRSDPPAAISAGLVTMIAVGLGMVLTALATFSRSQGTSLLGRLSPADHAFLSHLWSETGVNGVSLGAAGVLVAGLIAAVGTRPAAAPRHRLPS